MQSRATDHDQFRRASTLFRIRPKFGRDGIFADHRFSVRDSGYQSMHGEAAAPAERCEAMAPEQITKVIVLDLVDDGRRLLATRYIASLQGSSEFLVKWYPLESRPEGFQPIAGGVIFVPEEVTVAEERGVTIACTPRSCRYKDDADMLVLLLPPGTTLSWHHLPSGAKEFSRRVALYWLRALPGKHVEVVWALAPTQADARSLADDINAFVEDERGEVPIYSLDDYAHYDVALSYASEDRAQAEEIAVTLKKAGKHVFFDHDLRARLWGKGLGAELEAIYSKRTTFCVLLVSEHYTKKRWTLAELSAAVKGAARSKRRDYVLPLQLDETKLEGLPEDVAYVPIERGIAAICADVLEKLRRA